MPANAAVPGPSRRRRVAYAGILIFLAVIGGVLIGELYLRKWPRVPVQVVRGHNVHAIDGVPVWEMSDDRENRSCVVEHPERKRILFLGSSITYGFLLPPAESFPAELQDLLNAASPTPGFCVLNLAQISFTSPQKLAVASVEVPRYRPALVMWEGWNELAKWALLGNAAYEVRRHLLRPDGFPGMWGVPDALNRTLFLHSRLYEFLTLSQGQQDPNLDELTAARDRLERLAAVTNSAGSRLAIYECPWLSVPFGSPPPQTESIVNAFERAHHVDRIVLSDALAGEDYLALRMDPCCHFNKKGHEVLARILAQWVSRMLAGESTAPDTTAVSATTGRPMPNAPSQNDGDRPASPGRPP